MDFEPDFGVAQTDNIVVSACPANPEDDDEDLGFNYYMRIENNSDVKIQILSKNFNITDDKGKNYIDTGVGFNGEMPELEPGEYFEFLDTAPFDSAFAVLYGTCRIVKEHCNQIQDIKIPAINLIGNPQYGCALN